MFTQYSFLLFLREMFTLPHYSLEAPKGKCDNFQIPNRLNKPETGIAMHWGSMDTLLLFLLLKKERGQSHYS